MDLKILEAASLDSTVFLNRGNHFEARSLPSEAQFAPAFGIFVADFDGDGFQDIFLCQNFFAVDGTTGRYDAGRGILLKGPDEAVSFPFLETIVDEVSSSHRWNRDNRDS